MAAETSILVVLSVAAPLAVHLVPSDAVPWGARLLPLFYAPLIGVALFRLHVGLIPALLGPILNHLITGSPAPHLVGLLSVEAAVFVLVAYALLRLQPRFRLVGPVAYLGAKLVSGTLVALTPWFAGVGPASAFVRLSVETAIPGLLVLGLISLVVAEARKDRVASR